MTLAFSSATRFSCEGRTSVLGFSSSSSESATRALSGKRVAALVDLKKYGDLWEDFYDALTLEQRKHDKRIPLSEVRRRLVKAGKLGCRTN